MDYLCGRDASAALSMTFKPIHLLMHGYLVAAPLIDEAVQKGGKGGMSGMTDGAY